MDQLHFTNNIQSSITMIPNEFIDKYMKKADGEFVKIYLLMLRLSNQGIYIGPEQLADMLDLTQKDVLRALNYWLKEGLLEASPKVAVTVETSAKKPLTAEGSRSPSLAVDTTADPSVTARQVPKKREVSPKELQQEVKGTDLEQILYMVETYIGHTLSPSELSVFHYMDKQLHLPLDLIEYLVEYCVTKGKKSIRYMESVAINWYQQNIDSVKKAKEESSAYTQNVFPIMKAFGISNRNPAPPELDYIHKWNDMGFDSEIILEACNRTILSTHQASFPYANSILQKWKEQGVHTLADIRSLDENFQAKKPAVSVTTSAGSSTVKKASSNAFHNFDQDSYDYDDLEKRLLAIQHSS